MYVCKKILSISELKQITVIISRQYLIKVILIKKYEQPIFFKLFTFSYEFNIKAYDI